MDTIPITDELWDKALAHCKANFPDEPVVASGKRHWLEGNNPNFQGVIGELAFIAWLGGIPLDKYLDQRPVFKRDKGKDMVIGKYRIDVKTPALRVTPRKYHKFLIEDALVEKNIADIFVCEYAVKPDLKEIYLMGFCTPRDVLALGEKKEKGETIYGKVTAGYSGYLMQADLLGEPDELRLMLKGLTISDTLTADYARQ